MELLRRWVDRRKKRKHLARYIKRIRERCPLSEVETFKCPVCEGKVAVTFDPKGLGFAIGCCQSSGHFLLQREIDVPPDWWRSFICHAYIE